MLYDKDIREPLFEYLEEYYGKIRILEEKTMGKSRADVVMVTPDALYGIEIKSDADSYERLARQVRDYDRYYDYNYVVVGTRHAMHIEEHVPEWWGIITVESEAGTPDFYRLRVPRPNPKLDWKCKLGILWRPELAHIQEINHMPKYKDKSKSFVIHKIVSWIERETPQEGAAYSKGSYTVERNHSISVEKLSMQVCTELFERDYNTIEQTLEEYRKRRSFQNNKKRHR